MALNNHVEKFTLDMAPGGIAPVLNVSQGDIGRKFTADIFWGGSSYDVSGLTAKVRGRKRDNTVFEYVASLSGTTATFETKKQMTIIPGNVDCEIVFFDSSSHEVGTANFTMVVEEAPYDPDAPSQSVVPGIEDLIEQTIGGDVRDETDAWLDDHPEATTTVQDGAITKAKINTEFLPEIENAYVTPEMYGAVGDGTTDDTTAIQNAINENSYVKLSNKIYKCGTLTISHSCVIEGAENTYFGRGTILSNPNADTDGIIINSQNVKVANIHLKPTTTPSDVSALTNTGIKATATSNVSGLELYKTYVEYYGTGHGLDHRYLANIYFSRSVNCNIGFKVANCETTITLKKTWALYCATGYDINGAGYSGLYNCAADGCGDAYKLTDCTGVTLSACGAEVSQNIPFKFINSTCTLDGCKGYRNNSTGELETHSIFADGSFLTVTGFYEQYLASIIASYSLYLTNNSQVGVHASYFHNDVSGTGLYGDFIKNGERNIVRGYAKDSDATKCITTTKTGTTGATGIIEGDYKNPSQYEVVSVYCTSNANVIVLPFTISGGSPRWQFKLLAASNLNPVANTDVSLTIVYKKV